MTTRAHVFTVVTPLAATPTPTPDHLRLAAGPKTAKYSHLST